MKIDKFTKLLLVAIVIFLGIIALKPIFHVETAQADKNKEYMTLSAENFHSYDRDKALEKTLNKYAAEGWRLHSVVAMGEFVVLER